MTRLDFPQLWTDLGLTGLGVELGVDQADYSAFILPRWPGKMVLVDTWSRNHNGVTGEERLQICIKRLEWAKDRVLFCPQSSYSAAAQFENGILDWVYLDADHSYYTALADLFAWYPKLRVGGMIAGHDFVDVKNYESMTSYDPLAPVYDPSDLPVFGVKSAVRDFRNHQKISSTIGVTEEWPPSFYWVKEAQS